MLIAQGAHPKAVQEHLGHSSIRITFDRYGHMFPNAFEEIADRLDVVYAAAAAASPRPGSVVEMPNGVVG